MGLLNSLGIAVLLLAHQTKNGDNRYPFGSVFWSNLGRNTWNVQKRRDLKGLTHVGLYNTNRNHGPEYPPIGVRLQFDETKITIEKESIIEHFEDTLTVPKRIINLLKSGKKTSQQISENLEITLNHARSTMSKLKNDKIVLELEDGTWTLVYQEGLFS